MILITRMLIMIFHLRIRRMMLKNSFFHTDGTNFQIVIGAHYLQTLYKKCIFMEKLLFLYKEQFLFLTTIFQYTLICVENVPNIFCFLNDFTREKIMNDKKSSIKNHIFLETPTRQIFTSC